MRLTCPYTRVQATLPCLLDRAVQATPNNVHAPHTADHRYDTEHLTLATWNLTGKRVQRLSSMQHFGIGLDATLQQLQRIPLQFHLNLAAGDEPGCKQRVLHEQWPLKLSTHVRVLPLQPCQNFLQPPHASGVSLSASSATPHYISELYKPAQIHHELAAKNRPPRLASLHDRAHIHSVTTR